MSVLHSTLVDQLGAELEALREAGTFKHFNTLCSPQGPVVEMEGRGEVLVLSSNNYLGLAARPEVVGAGIEGLRRYGAGTASVRFICGTFAPHIELERELAGLVGTDAALTYGSCWNANEAVIPSLTDDRTVILSDELNHASIVELARSHDAVVVLDDSHGTGVMGAAGRGIAEHFGLLGEIDVITSTLGKALGGAAAGFVASSEEVCEMLRQRSRPHLFSNAIPPTVACSALEAVRVLRREPALVERLRELSETFRSRLRALGFQPLDGEAAIIPIIVGATEFAIRFSRRLLEEGVFVTGFGYPVVPEGTARVRVQMSAALEPEHLERALEAFGRVGRELGLI